MMSLSILSWNVRGLGCSEKRIVVKDIGSKHKADILLFQETKIKTLDRNIIR